MFYACIFLYVHYTATLEYRVINNINHFIPAAVHNI